MKEKQNNDDLRREVADLERRVKDLEDRREFHFHFYPPVTMPTVNDPLRNPLKPWIYSGFPLTTAGGNYD